MLLRLKVHPDAGKNEILRRSPDLYEVWVRAPAERGLANAACLALLGKELGIVPGRIRLIKGGRSPGKIVEVP